MQISLPADTEVQHAQVSVKVLKPIRIRDLRPKKWILWQGEPACVTSIKYENHCVSLGLRRAYDGWVFRTRLISGALVVRLCTSPERKDDRE